MAYRPLPDDPPFLYLAGYRIGRSGSITSVDDEFPIGALTEEEMKIILDAYGNSEIHIDVVEAIALGTINLRRGGAYKTGALAM